MHSEDFLRHQLPASGRKTWRDDTFPGLELIGRKSGASWFLRHRIGGRRVRDKLGRWPELGHKEARAAAKTLVQATAMKEVAGGDAYEHRKGKRRKSADRRKSETMGAALDVYASDRLAGLRSGDHAEKVLRNVFAALLSRRLVEIEQPDLIAAIDEKRRTAPSMADLSVRYAKPFWGWVARTGRGTALLQHEKVRQTRKRERTLSMLELGAIANALEEIGPTVPALMVRTMLGTAARAGEVSWIERHEIELADRLWTQPASKNKSDRVHMVPLNDYAATAINEMMIQTNNELLFAGKTGKTPFSGWSKFKASLDKASGITEWTFHDFRRTFATIAADNGVDPHVADRCLNHTGAGTTSTVARVYQRSEFLEQRREAMNIWNDAIERAKDLAN